MIVVHNEMRVVFGACRGSFDQVHRQQLIGPVKRFELQCFEVTRARRLANTHKLVIDLVASRYVGRWQMKLAQKLIAKLLACLFVLKNQTERIQFID